MTDIRLLYPSLRQRVVIVTGAGRGLGREMALALVEAGARVVATAAKEIKELAQVEREAEELAGDDRLISVKADVTDEADCNRVVAATLKAFGALHGLVNNAGRGMRLVSEAYTSEPTRFWETDPATWRQIVDANINGAFQMARAAMPHLLRQGWGRVVNISTSNQTMVREGYSPYGATKAALEAMSVSWAKELDGTGVTVNVLLPGGASNTRMLPEGPNKRGADGQLLSPALMRAPILWLCADDSNGMTGGRYIAKLWDPALPPAEAAAKARQPRHDVPAIM
jgi:3-oxoacyl-[acyl-carrier protein] reductase